MPKEKLKILVLEDNPDDVALLRIAMKRLKLPFVLEPIQTEEELNAQELSLFDLIITDYNLGLYNGLSAIKKVRSINDFIPIILLSGTIGEELAVDVIHSGANDFVLKSNLKKIPLAIERVLSEATMKREKIHFQRELLSQKLLLDTIFNSFESLVFLKGIDGRYVKVNQVFCDFFERSEEEILGKTETELFPMSDASLIKQNDELVIVSGKSTTHQINLYSSSGKGTTWEITKTPIMDGDTVTGIVGNGRDVTEEKQLQDTKSKAQSILYQAEKFTKSGSFEYDYELDVLNCSPNFMQMMKLDLPGQTISFRKLKTMVKSEDRKLFQQDFFQAIKSKIEYNSEVRFNLNTEQADSYGYFRLIVKPDYKDLKGNKFYGTILDITPERESNINLMQRQEDERKEIARDLHDNLGQKLNAASMYVSKVSDNLQGHDGLDRIKDILHETIDTLGHIISNISVKQIEEHSLQYSLDRLLSFLPDSFEIKQSISVEEDRVSSFVKTQLYRVAQEAINNATKYSKASCIKLKMIQDHGIINLKIEDDGIGFVVEDAMRGNGLQNIAYRVKKSNGLVNINSEPGKGTQINVKMPIN